MEARVCGVRPDPEEKLPVGAIRCLSNVGLIWREAEVVRNGFRTVQNAAVVYSGRRGLAAEDIHDNRPIIKPALVLRTE